MLLPSTTTTVIEVSRGRLRLDVIIRTPRPMRTMISAMTAALQGPLVLSPLGEDEERV